MVWVSTPLWKILQICVPSGITPIGLASTEPMTRSVGGLDIAVGNQHVDRGESGWQRPSMPLIRPNWVSYTPPISSCIAFISSGSVTAG